MLTAPADAYEIFSRARAAWLAQQYPAHLSYTIAVNVSEHGIAKGKHYHLTFDSATQTVTVNPVSDEELAAPPVPTGFTLHLQARRQGRMLVERTAGNPGEAVDYLGVPKLAPAYSFGLLSRTGTEQSGDTDELVRDIRAQFNDPLPAQQAQYLPSHRVIATVVSRSHAYTIRLAAVEDDSAGSMYHLLLTPNGDPHRFRLRELWVDTQTFVTRKLLVADNLGTGAPWIVTFAQHDGALYIDSETAQAPVCVQRHCYERAAISFQSIAPAAAQWLHGWFLTSQAVLTDP